MTPPSLFLHEEVLLLALEDRKGTIDFGSPYAYAIGGALLAELLVRGRIEVTGSGRKRLVQVLDGTPVGEALLDESLGRIAGAKRRGSLMTWVARLAGSRKLRDRLAEGLCRRGILRAEEKEVLFFFKRRMYPALDPGPERDVVGRLRQAILTDMDVDDRTVVLLALANSARLLPMVCDKKELKRREDRIEALVRQDVFGTAVKSAIETAEVAAALIIVG